MRLREDSDTRSASVNILPMIDVIFAILAFFIISTLYLTSTESLPVTLPDAVTATPQNQVSFTLTITAEGDLSLRNESIESEAIALSDPEDIAPLLAQNAPSLPVSVIVSADKATPHGVVISAIDNLRAIPNVRLSIATTQP